MPKPSFMQSVLRKPTRSYADPYAPSPWSDYSSPSNDYYEPPSSRYAPRIDDGVHLGFRERDGPEEAGPSRRRQAPLASTVSTVSDSHRTVGNRFPRAARRAQSTVSLREAAIVQGNEFGDHESVRSGTVKKKKKPPKVKSEAGSTMGSDIMDSPTSSIAPPQRRPRPKQTRTISSSTSTTTASSRDILQPPPLQPRSEDASSSSTASSPIPPSSPTVDTCHHINRQQAQSRPAQRRPSLSMVQKSLPSHVAPPLTPPSSDRSSTMSIKPRPAPSQPAVTTIPPPKPIKSPKRLSVTSFNDSDTEEETFYTPRASLDLSQADIEIRSVPSPPDITVPSYSMELPSLRFQPPTPAPIADPDNSPFHSVPSSSASSSLHPDDQPTPRPFDRQKMKIEPSTPTPAAPKFTAESVGDDDDVHSATGEVGSDSDEESERRLGETPGRHSRTSSFTRPKSRNGSRTGSEVLSSGTPASEDRRPVSRQSTTRGTSRNSFDDFVVRRNSAAPSPQPFDGQRAPSRAASIRSSVSGYGKGGWAAAAASSRSGAVTPVMMLMPQAGNDGWAEFQQPPPRQSRFTPLPQPAQPKTFNSIVYGQDMQDGSVPSSYSQGSDAEEDEGPTPSRSYARKDYQSENGYSESPSQSSATRSEQRFEAALRQRQINLNGDQYSDLGRMTVPPPQQHPQTLQRLTRDPSQRMSSQSSSQYDQYQARPPSSPPMHSRPPSRAATDSYGSQRQYIQSMNRPPSPPPLQSRPPLRAATDSYGSQRQYVQSMQRPQSPYGDGPMSPISRPSSRMGFDPPSFLNPDTITLLPEMSQEDSARTYAPSEPARPPRRANSVFGGFSRHAKSEIFGYNPDDNDENDHVPDLPAQRSKSALGQRPGDRLSQWGGSSAGEGVLMESNGRGPESVSGYTNLILPAGAYKPSDPARTASEINSRAMGLPHASMAAIVLNHIPHKDTPLHLRDMNPPVDFASHLKPPARLSRSQVLVQVYAVAVDEIDVRALDDKNRGDVGRWVPGRSFVGRCLSVGVEEKELVRGDIIVGLVDVRKSGALAEYILCERRRVARAPYPTSLSLEQLAALPLQGVPAARAVRTHLIRHSRALIIDAHMGIPALVCQEMARAGVHVTAVISGGDGSHEAQSACMANGARGVLTGSPAGVMMGLDEGGWDYIMDTWGGQRIYDAAKRILKDGGKLTTLVEPTEVNTAASPIHSRSSGLKTLKVAFGSKKKDQKAIKFEYLPPAGSGEPEVDSSGVDCRDVLEENCMSSFRPVVGNGVPLERGADVFRGRKGVAVVRLIN